MNDRAATDAPVNDEVRRIADAVLYEGYILWPYRRSAPKNQRRWTFGGVYPPRHSDDHPDDRSSIRAQVLVEGAAPQVDVRVRFLHVVERRIRAGGELVDDLVVDGERHLAWDEAAEREVAVTAEGVAEIAIAGATAEEPLGDDAALVRTWEPLRGSVAARLEPLGEGLHRLTVDVRNETAWEGDDREDALRRTFCSTHAVLRADEGELVSLTDPPEDFRREAAGCENTGVWPVLVGAEGDRSTMLAAPIILGDYPQIAPESPGDLFDATEIDQLLILNVLSLTESEQEEMRASDPRAREILERCAALTPQQRMRLNGAVREFRATRDFRPARA